MRRPAALAVAVLALGLCAGAAADPRGDSTNWAGYAVMGAPFTAVAGSWVQPAANCLSRSTSFTQAAFWVGLGGNSPSSTKVEQIGTDSDCDPDGSGDYYAWYELWPANVVVMRLDIEAGDRLSASVGVEGRSVVLRLHNLTTGERFTKIVRMASPDTSSAEWIAEAPTAPLRHGSQVVAMTDFGTVRFARASASSSGGHTGPISDPAWHASAIDFESELAGGRNPNARFTDEEAAAHGFPTVLTRRGSAFSVTWKHGATPARARTVPVGAA